MANNMSSIITAPPEQVLNDINGRVSWMRSRSEGDYVCFKRTSTEPIRTVYNRADLDQVDPRLSDVLDALLGAGYTSEKVAAYLSATLTYWSETWLPVTLRDFSKTRCAIRDIAHIYINAIDFAKGELCIMSPLINVLHTTKNGNTYCSLRLDPTIKISLSWMEENYPGCKEKLRWAQSMELESDDVLNLVLNATNNPGDTDIAQHMPDAFSLAEGV